MCIFFSAVCFSFAAVKQMPVQKLHVFFSPSVPLAPAVPYTPHAAMEQATASPKSTRQPLSSVPLPPVALTISRGDGTGNRLLTKTDFWDTVCYKHATEQYK